ncbi:NAD(P)H-dependent oxidoreductase subunit E [Clostridium sp. CM028]|uniref:complex I 24 kDa subunit family protein n=1 Tax=unclassified Clostridium TaxID=2614128 RepID=UPI001C6F2102|nr:MULTISPECIES: NAD(P)H-dependent oxidoreductase subunit E [unclassified Clostridium]MBW9145896.1 NAD(P)H-dependent oxidoreductase subunit E [Clostridium sp. CM027]MBW9149585.1 NAD(P)H-dependent oxidoreductase subunit E [Clostridium sp. CM028]UVE40875.1 NAD(P)H-dependent oxidoreductase subunit E [Clostridium sp. CM027]WLC61543.1 NAD(P)H-dependent oxidoreductase subunit E [Clostridium sp. CM028]
MNTIFDYSKLDTILENHKFKSSNIIAILQDTQECYRYLPKEVFSYLSEKLGMSRAKIYSVATFYENFSLQPKGKFIIKICDGTACHVRKSAPILEKLREHLKLSETKTTTDDLTFTLETVSCLGVCGLAPAMSINDKVHGSMTPEKAMELLNTLKEEK